MLIAFTILNFILFVCAD